MKFYPCVDGPLDRDLRVVATNEVRPPRAGEWFLSGARIAGYLATNDLSRPYRIARLVRVKKTVWKIVVETIV